MWHSSKRNPRKPRRPLPTVWISASVIDRTVDGLQQSGELDNPHEGFVYWAGRATGDEYFVLKCIAPAARTTYGSFDTSSHANARVIMCLAENGMELLAQVHSHPGTLVGHSDGDDERALMPYEGFLSIVVPRYARRGMNPLTSCGVHVFENAQFRRLDNSEVKRTFRIVDELADLRNE